MLARLLSAAGGGLRWLDDAVIAGLVGLLAFAPMAFGAVHQWAYTLVETGAFALLILWMARVWLEGARPARTAIARTDLMSIARPAALFALLLALQVVPLPPALLRTISPGTYRLYSASFPGWPEAAPYEFLRPAWSANPRGSSLAVEITLPPVGAPKQARVQAAAPPAEANLTPSPPERPSPEALGDFGDLRWRSIAIAPTVTWAGLIDLLSCAAVFFLVLAYPFGFVGAEREADARFIRALVFTLIGLAAMVGLIGLVEKATWNGCILWFFVPQDWSGPDLSIVRASGPFVNPDHFADFLAMILPLAVVGSIFPITLNLNRGERKVDLRLPSAVGAFLMAAGIALSLSRGAWIASVAGVGLGLALSFKHARQRAPVALRGLSTRAIPLAMGGLVIFLLLLLFVIGPGGRSAAAGRIGSTIAQGDSLGLKPTAWRDSLQMIRDFPIFGVGLGCWPELFPHYQRAPWMSFYFRQVENDYIQLLAETGLAGVALALWFGATLWRKAQSAAVRMSERRWPLFAGLAAGVAGSLIHELFDFSLHTPANALLFSVLLAAALRLALTQAADRPQLGLRSVSTPSAYTYAGAGLIAASAAALIVAVQIQRNATYPYDIGSPKTFAQAESAAVDHPADSGVHLALAALMPPGAPAALRRQELRAAVWLNPNDPMARDVYARSLLLDGNKREGLRQVTLSVFHAPEIDNHFYLQPRTITWLLPDEQQAIYEGFGQAIAARYEGSAQGLAQFYRALGRYTEAAEVSAEAAGSAGDDDEKLNDLLTSGEDYAQARKFDLAEQKLRAAIEIDPTDEAPYRALMVDVLGPERDAKGVREVAQEALTNGADEIPIELALADAAHLAGDSETAEATLIQVTREAPTLDSMMHLGDFYNETGKYDRAVMAYEHATEIDPGSALAYFKLGQAEESTFDFASANHDYARAIKLAPDDQQFRQASLDLQRRTSEALKQPPDK